MAVKGQATKNRLMDIAARLILNNGFAAMSIDEVIKDAGFFYIPLNASVPFFILLFP